MVLAGGVGSRFWPVSTPDRPKQLLPLAGERPLVADTVERARAIAPDRRIRIVAGERLTGALRRVLEELPEPSFMVEPRARGTGPALTWAAWEIHRVDPEAVLVSLHSDHLIEPTGTFARVIGAAARVAREHRVLVTVPVPPDRPEVGYGYVQPGEALAAPEPDRAFRIRAFHEKPDRETATRYLEEGYLWNSGIFVWRADDFLDEVRDHAPEIGRLLVHLERGEAERFFAEAPRISVDEAVLERSRKVAAVEGAFRWDDVGSWEALARTIPADEGGNHTVGHAHVVEGGENVVYADDAPVVLFGVEGLVAVRTAGVTLVTRREHAPRLKELLRSLPESLRNPEV